MFKSSEEVRKILKERRLEKHLTLKEVADAVGVSEATISRWESGDIENMRRDRIMALAKALDISPTVIMGCDDSIEEVIPLHRIPKETMDIAEKIDADPTLKELFDVAVDADPENIQIVTMTLKKLNRT